jgi:hypothetical protein
MKGSRRRSNGCSSPERTTLHLCESGFVRPEDQEGNSKGWDAELGELVELLSG